MRLDLEQTRAVVDRAFDLGITLFDTADMYGGRGGSETQLGKILGHRRKDIVLASKFGMAMSDDGTKIGASRRYIMSAVEDSLRRLKTDWIDLYQLHQPDPLTPLDETMQALDDLVTQGKIRYIGLSNETPWGVSKFLQISKERNLPRMMSVQNPYNLLNRTYEIGLAEISIREQIGLLAYSPLAIGFLTGKYRNNERPKKSRLAVDGDFWTRYNKPNTEKAVEAYYEIAKKII